MKKILFGVVGSLMLIGSSLRAEMTREAVISTFHTFIALNNDFKYSVEHQKGKSGKPYSVLRQEVESFHTDKYLPAAQRASNIICQKGDKDLLREFMAVFINNRNSADEEPSALLGEIFACQSQLVVSVFGDFNQTDQKTIYDALEFGFNQDPATPDHDKLLSTLSSLRKKAYAKEAN